MDTNTNADQSAIEDQHVHNLPIFIDGDKFEVPDGAISGQALRELPDPDVPADRDLWLEVPGPADDVLINPTETYEVKAGMNFYTAPATINPGGGR